MTESGLVPSFVSVGDGFVAWTGKFPNGYSRMYIYDISSRTNAEIPDPHSVAGNYYNPCADGSTVVYQGAPVGRYDDIYLYDNGSQTVRQLTYNTDPGDGHDWNPRIDNGRIVWEKHMLGVLAKSGVYLYDMNRGTIERIFEGEKHHSPDIWGDYVVCVKDAEIGNTTEIILYNIKTREAKSIASADKSNLHPRIDSGKVVWSSSGAPSPIYYPWETQQIYVYDIADDQVQVWTDSTTGNMNPSIGGGVIAWEQIAPTGIGAHDYVNQAKGTFSEGKDVHAPDCAESGAVWFDSTSLYYAVRMPNGPFFIDVDEKDPYSQAINAMATKGIIEGYANGLFGPRDLVIRQQFAKLILLTMAELNPAIYTPSFRDTCYFVDAAEIERTTGKLYPYYHVARATRTQLTLGYPDGTFRPLANITRQQVITMIVRAGSSVLENPPGNWQGVLSYINVEHGERIRIAEYNGLLNGLVGGTWGGLAGWDTSLDANRGEVAQMLYNLLNRLVSSD